MIEGMLEMGRVASVRLDGEPSQVLVVGDHARVEALRAHPRSRPVSCLVWDQLGEVGEETVAVPLNRISVWVLR